MDMPITTCFEKEQSTFQRALRSPVDLLAAAVDLVDRGEHSLAVLLAYRAADRALEDWAAQFLPFTGWDQPPHLDLRGRFTALWSELYPAASLEALPPRPGFAVRAGLLHLLDPRRFPREKLQDLLAATSARHRAWFIHGDEVPGAEASRDLLVRVRHLLFQVLDSAEMR